MDLLDFLTTDSNSNTLSSVMPLSKSKSIRRARDVVPEIPKFENTISRLQRANRRSYSIKI